MRHYGGKELAKEIALVPQDFYVNFPFTVEEILLMGRHPYIPRFASPSSDDLQIVDQVMEVLKIAKFKRNYITELSGGEKQRVIFARALAQDTPVVLLDEATSNMDIRYTLDILDIVAGDVETRGKTVIAALHNLNLAATYCDKLVFMKSGRVVSHGDRDQVLTEETLYEVFGIESRVYFDEYVGSRQVVFRRRTL
ncbi:MAG: ABC transporter ATP-binding protein [Deltaproteobacteria bacterium]|nr:MAG: ABC transporter ATP-binding protein [Deltaproteobacteria bacterium]